MLEILVPAKKTAIGATGASHGRHHWNVRCIPGGCGADCLDGEHCAGRRPSAGEPPGLSMEEREAR